MRHPRYALTSSVTQFAKMSLVVTFSLLLVVFLSPAVSGEEDSDYRDCIRDVDLVEKKLLVRLWVISGNANGHYSYHKREKTIVLDAAGRHYLSPSVQVAAIRYSYANTSLHYESRLMVGIFDDRATDEAEHGNDTIPGPVYIAARSMLLKTLGPAVFDVLTLSSMSVGDRTNTTTIVLPLPLCPDIDHYKAHCKFLQLVLMISDMDRDTLQLMKLDEDKDVSVFFSVTLFMPLGLLSLFLTIIIFPRLSRLLVNFLTPRFDKMTLETAELGLLSTASLLAGFFIFYWVSSAVVYYCRFSDTVDSVIFQSKVFSPMTQCIIFYFLAGMAGFVGGMLFSQCSHSSRAHVTCCKIMGHGLLSACMTTAIFHSVFLMLALFQEPIPVLTNLVVLVTVNSLLFLALFAILEQFRRARFQGNFILVVMMQMTLSSLYYSLVSSFRRISFDDDNTVSTPPYLCVVTAISTACILLSVAMVIMMANKNTNNKKDDVENPPIKDEVKSASGGGGGGGKSREMVVVNPQQGAADLAAVARDMGFVVLVPNVVQAWQRRGRVEEKT